MPQTLSSDEAPAESADASAHQQLSAMIDAGRAFSGHERNCCFLNTGDGKFANLSAGSGLDFPDDGRAMAVTDWDQDGDLDLWISNRNAPRLRLMRNDAQPGNHHLALLLVGDGKNSNRDAIGARVEVRLAGGDAGMHLSASVRAGEGFLSQSSKWIHFGLGVNSEIEGVDVLWPDGSHEQFSNFAADRRYRLEQGSGIASISPTRDPAAITLLAAPQPEPAPSSAARIPAVTLLRAPKINLRRSDGRQAGKAGSQSQLITLWATWCAPCRKELKQFSDHSGALRAAGVDLLALNVDGIGAATAGARDPAEILAELEFPFAATAATRPLIDAFQQLHDRLVGLNQPLPIPTSFLIDAQGRLSVIYKGPVAIEQILADLRHSEGTLAERSKRSAQIEGSMISHPAAMQAANMQEAAIQHRYGIILQAIGDLDSAAFHFRSALALNRQSAASARQLAQINLAKRDWAKAVELFEIALELNPADPDGHQMLGQLYAGLGQIDAAKSHFERALKQEPGHVSASYGMAALLEAGGDTRRAIGIYEGILKSQPGNQMAANNLAWIFATHPDDSIRDPARAIILARALHTAPGEGNPNHLDTLAAAEAAVGNFQSAAATAQRAIDLAITQKQQNLAADLAKRREVYRSGKAFVSE